MEQNKYKNKYSQGISPYVKVRKEVSTALNNTPLYVVNDDKHDQGYSVLEDYVSKLAETIFLQIKILNTYAIKVVQPKSSGKIGGDQIRARTGVEIKRMNR